MNYQKDMTHLQTPTLPDWKVHLSRLQSTALLMFALGKSTYCQTRDFKAYSVGVQGYIFNMQIHSLLLIFTAKMQ